jgi:hypothetical protein
MGKDLESPRGLVIPPGMASLAYPECRSQLG